MDVVMRLYRLGLLPATVAALEGEDSQAAVTRLPRPAASRSSSAAPSLLSRAFLRWNLRLLPNTASLPCCQRCHIDLYARQSGPTQLLRGKEHSQVTMINFYMCFKHRHVTGLLDVQLDLTRDA